MEITTINIFRRTKELLDNLKIDIGRTIDGRIKQENYSEEIERLLRELLERRRRIKKWTY